MKWMASLLQNYRNYKLMTTQTDNPKELLKILIGAAWIDGQVKPEEQAYLCRMAKENGVDEDLELKPLLYQLRPVSTEECYRWLEAYLGDHPRLKDYENLLEAISGLIYSDGDVDTEEAKLLARLQSFDPNQEHPNSVFTSFLKRVRKLYRSALNQAV